MLLASYEQRAEDNRDSARGQSKQSLVARSTMVKNNCERHTYFRALLRSPASRAPPPRGNQPPSTSPLLLRLADSSGRNDDRLHKPNGDNDGPSDRLGWNSMSPVTSRDAP